MHDRARAFKAALFAFGAVAVATFAAGASAQAASPPPVYIHENGANQFLENFVAVRPGQAVVFVNEDTGPHTIVGYEPYNGGAMIKGINGSVAGTEGPGHKVSTYRVSFAHTGVYPYYCSVHAKLVTVYDHGGDHYVAARPTAEVMGPPVDGYGGAMAGVIIVTTDPHILAITPVTAHEKILKNFFGG
ncbi:MAG: cupredoxin domain-containing protein [Rhodanobacteraceae bacterium]